MATHRSAIKRHKQNLKRKARNTAIKSTIKTALKKVRGTIKEGNIEEARNSLLYVTSLLDKAVSKGVLHRNSASRKISRLAISVNSRQKV